MQLNLKIAIWNANGILNHISEIELFLSKHCIDVLLISETHLTTKSYLKINNYELITANQPNDRAHAGAAILIKSYIKYEILNPVQINSLQAASIKIKTSNSLVISAIYFPPRFNVQSIDYKLFFDTLGPNFIAGGDYNAKHPWWGSRLINPKGRELYKCVSENKLNVLSTGRPTYWPSDPQKIPDVLDFVIFKGISAHSLDITDSNELSSDHSPLLLIYNSYIQTIASKYAIISKNTNIKSFQHHINSNINLNISLKTGHDLDEMVEWFNNLIHEASIISTPTSNIAVKPPNKQNFYISAEVDQLLKYKRKLRKIWQNSRNPLDKTKLNRATKKLKEKIIEAKNKSVSEFLQSIDIHNTGEHCLWNAVKYLKRPTKRNVPFKNQQGVWCRTDADKANSFAEYLEANFQPYDFADGRHIEHINNYLDTPCQMDLPIKHVTVQETKTAISKLKNVKSPGYDFINAKTAKVLPSKAVKLLTIIFNAIIRLNHFPLQWKCAEIIMIPKPQKPEGVISSYRPISLLVTFSKLFERILLRRLLPILEAQNIIPEHQFGFRHRHGTPEQCHRIIHAITETLENKMYCSAVFLDVEKAFDRVWHTGLLYKIKKLLPAPYFHFFRSYLNHRSFYVKVNDEKSKLCKIAAGIPQGSVLGPVLYTLYTSDMPNCENALIATYADDTAILASHKCAIEASNCIQNYLDVLENWLKSWNIKINAEKSVHVTFTMRRNDCPKVKMYNIEIPQRNSVKYLGMYIDRRLTWREHIKNKRKQLNIKTKKMYWLIGRKSELSIENKIRLYKAILRPVWTYGVQLWGTASNSNIDIIQRYQSKTLRILADAPWYIRNSQLHKDLKIAFVKDKIKILSERYLNRLSYHDNLLAICLLDQTMEIRRLKRIHTLDVPFRL